MENLALRSSITQVKIIGTLVSISGAMVVVFCKGPTIISPSQSLSLSLHSPRGTSETKWVIGGLLLAVEYLLLSGCSILQVLLFDRWYFKAWIWIDWIGLDCISVWCAACAKSHIGCSLSRSWLGLYKWLWLAMTVTWLVLSIYSTNVSNNFLVLWHCEPKSLDKLNLNSLEFFTDPSFENIFSRDSCGLPIRLVYSNYICTNMFNGRKKPTCLDTKAWCNIGDHFILGKNQETWKIPNDRTS